MISRKLLAAGLAMPLIYLAALALGAALFPGYRVLEDQPSVATVRRLRKGVSKLRKRHANDRARPLPTFGSPSATGGQSLAPDPLRDGTAETAVGAGATAAAPPYSIWRGSA